MQQVLRSVCLLLACGLVSACSDGSSNGAGGAGGTSAAGGSAGSSGSGGSSGNGGTGGAAGSGGSGGSSASGGSAGSSGSAGSGGTGGTSSAGCEPLPAPSGNVTQVTPDMAGELRDLLAGAEPGETFVFASGNYSTGGAQLWITAPGVTLRSASGQPGDVVIDANYEGSEILTVAASDVTIAEITIQRAYTHPIHVVSTDAGDTLNTRIYRVHVIDPREQAIKINPHGAQTYFPDDGEIACSHLELTDAGRPRVSGCYTGGVDAHQARGWVIRDNTIEGFWCESGLSEHAIHLWRGCRDTLVERNRLLDNARGVGFGLADSGQARTYSDNPCPAANGTYVDHYGGIIRNNFILGQRAELFASSAGFDSGIALWSACNATAVHNTIVSTGALFASIEWRFAGASGVTITNNLCTHPLRERDGAAGAQAGNIDQAALSDFVSVSTLDLHLAANASALDQGVSVAPAVCPEDIDGDARSATPDVGADEAD